MDYKIHFKLADDLIHHLDSVAGGLTDPFIASRYVGFVAVVGTTVYELAIKEIFIEFSWKKHRVLGNFVSRYFDRLNGRIKADQLRNEYLPRFGDSYVKKYKKLESEAENFSLQNHKVSLLSSYNNLIEWRHQFSHGGQIPTTPSYKEVTSAYELGKEIIHCLAKALGS
ncbi:MAG: HEPN domain-containing protein [Deltaproteobacteria bacterium]